MNFGDIQQKSKRVIDEMFHVFKAKGKQVVGKVAESTKKRAAEITE